ncbi:hypothetical protein GCM10027258_10490 [Amycolatopsis stemonae]
MPAAARDATAAFWDDHKHFRTAVAAVRMRKHRYTSLAQPEGGRHIDPKAGPDEPLRAKFRGPGRHSIWEHIESKVSQILHKSRVHELDDDFSVDRDVLTRLMRILYAICDSTSVYPHISPDGDGGVAAVWYADEFSLEIIVDREGDAYAIVKIGSNMLSVDLDNGDTTALRAIRGHLGRLTAHVKVKNPQWRDLVR